VNAIKTISYKIYTGLSERTSKVLNNPEADRNGSKVYGWGPWAMSTGVRGKGSVCSTSLEPRRRRCRKPCRARDLQVFCPADCR